MYDHPLDDYYKQLFLKAKAERNEKNSGNLYGNEISTAQKIPQMSGLMNSKT